MLVIVASFCMAGESNLLPKYCGIVTASLLLKYLPKKTEPTIYPTDKTPTATIIGPKKPLYDSPTSPINRPTPMNEATNEPVIKSEGDFYRPHNNHWHSLLFC